MSAPRVVACGEALVDLIAAAADARTWHAMPGGSPFNAAVAAARLGAPASFLGVFSDDSFGQLLRDHLDRSRVNWRGCPVTDEPTTLAVVSQPPGETEPAFAFHLGGTTTTSSRIGELHLPSDTRIFHTSGSLSLVVEPAGSRIEALLAAARHRGLVHLDANPRPRIARDRNRFGVRLERWLGLVDVLKISEADIAWLAPGVDPLELASRWVDPDLEVEMDEVPDTPAAVIVTRGSAGAAVVRPGSVVSVEAESVDVVDTVGAGDAFVGAMLAAFSAHRVIDRGALVRLDARWWRTALSHAAHVAGIACTRRGADPPWRNEL